MTTTVTAPINRTVTTFTVDRWTWDKSRNPNLSVRLNDSRFDVEIVERFADGTEHSRKVVAVLLSDLSPAAMTLIRNMDNAINGYLRTKGDLPAGTDTADL